MGKYERDWAEYVEKQITAGISGESVENHDQSIVSAITDHIENLYKKKIATARWVGAENYDDAGDIHVFLEDMIKICVELKVSQKEGSGTKANTTTNILKKYIDQAINYPDFDNKLGLLTKRYEFIQQIAGIYPSKASQYKKILRELRDTGRTDVLEKIAEITSPGQQQYAVYVSNLLNDNISSTQKMVDAILGGNNTTKSTITENLVYCVVKNYSGKNQTVEFYNFDEIDSTVAKVISSGKSVKILNNAGKSILTLSVTWKNICQGGATPCFNVFIGNALD